MADKYLLEDGTGNYVLEDDSGGELVLEAGGATEDQVRDPQINAPRRYRRAYDFKQFGSLALLTEITSVPSSAIQSLVKRPEWPRGLRTWIFQGQPAEAVTPAEEFMPARALPEGLPEPPRRAYGWVRGFAVAADETPIGQSVQRLALRPEFLRGLRTWIQSQLIEEGLPVGESVQRLVARPEWPRALRTWLQSQIFEEQVPVGQPAYRLVTRPLPRVLRTWTQTQLSEEQLPIGQSVQRLVPRPEFLRVLRTLVEWKQLEEVVETQPAGRNVQRLVRWPDYPLNLRGWTQSLGAALFPEFMPGPVSSFYDFRTVRFSYGAIRGSNVGLFSEVAEAQPAGKIAINLTRWPVLQRRPHVPGIRTFEEAETPPPKPGQLPKVVWARRDYGWAQAANIALLTEVAERPVGGSVSRRIPDAEYPRSLRSLVAAQLIEEQMPPRSGQWPLTRWQRQIYGWIQATNIALLEEVVTAPVGASVLRRIPDPEYPRSLRSRTTVQLFEEQMPVGRTAFRRIPDPEFLRSLRSRAQGVPYQEQIPAGKATFQRLRDPEFLRSLRAWSRKQTLEEGMPVGEATFRRLPDPEFLRSLRSWAVQPPHVTAVDQTIIPDFLTDPDAFFDPTILQAAPPPTYDYPIGRDMKSDYGKRGRRRDKYIIGRR